MRRPDALAPRYPRGGERESVLADEDAAVEEQRPLAARGRETGPARLEAATVGLGDDA